MSTQPPVDLAVTGRLSGRAAVDRLATLAARLVGAASGRIALLADGPPEPVGGEAAGRLRVPLTTRDGTTVGELTVVDGPHRTWSDGDRALLEQLAASAVTELELAALGRDFAASRTGWELAIEAAGIGSFDWDLATGRLVWDQPMLELFGYAPNEFDRTVEAFNARVHPDDLPRVSQALDEAIATCGDYRAEYRIVRPDGEVRWVQARGRALCDSDGTPVRVLGAGYDTTAVREADARVVRVLESMSAAFFALDRDWRFTYANTEAERLLGLSGDELLGGTIWELFPESLGTAFETNYRAALDTGEPTAFEAYYPQPLDGWFEVRAWPGPDGLSVYFHDVTAQREARQQAARAAARTSLLGEVASELSGTLDAEEAVARLARLVVPQLGDWCLVTLVDQSAPGPVWGQLRDIGWWHVDPSRRGLVERYARARLGELTDGSFLAGVLDTTAPIVVPEAATQALLDVFQPGVARQLVQTLAPAGAAFLPMRAHGRTVGIISLYWDAASTSSDWDLDTAVEVASRAALALDNARLYAEQRRLAEALQRSLLTAPPRTDRLDVAVRYEPAAETAQVGGDWYDAFRLPDGNVVLVIGDVVGHDTEAAAAMGQVRSLLRGIATTTGAGPAEVLERLDAAMHSLEVDTTATAVAARIDPRAEDGSGSVTLRWSNAGHPPPVLVAATGEVRVLGSLGADPADLLLGFDPSAPRGEQEVVLAPGSTVVVYTDGLVERRGRSIDDGLRDLTATLAELCADDLERVCDEVLARLLPDGAEDDVALAAVRVRPRPGGRDV